MEAYPGCADPLSKVALNVCSARVALPGFTFGREAAAVTSAEGKLSA